MFFSNDDGLVFQRMTSSKASPSMLMCAAGLPEQAVQEWSRAVPTITGDYELRPTRIASFREFNSGGRLTFDQWPKHQ